MTYTTVAAPTPDVRPYVYVDTAIPTVLSRQVGATDTAIYPQSLIGYPTDFPYLISIDRSTQRSEVMLVTAAVDGALLVNRAVDGVRSPHAKGATVEHVVTAIDYRNANAHYSDTVDDPHSQYLNIPRHSSLQRHQPGVSIAVPNVQPGPFSFIGSSDEGLSATPAWADHSHSVEVSLSLQARVVPAPVVMILPAAAISTPTWLGNNAPSSQTLKIDLPLIDIPEAPGLPTAAGVVSLQETVYPDQTPAPVPAGYTTPGSVLTESQQTYSWSVTYEQYVPTASSTYTTYLVFSTPLQSVGFEMGYTYSVGSPQVNGAVQTNVYEQISQADWVAATGNNPTSAPTAGGSPLAVYPNTAYEGSPTPLYFYTLTQTETQYTLQMVSSTETSTQTVVTSTPPCIPMVWGVSPYVEQTVYYDTTSTVVDSVTYTGSQTPLTGSTTYDASGSSSTTVTYTPISQEAFISATGWNLGTPPIVGYGQVTTEVGSGTFQGFLYAGTFYQVGSSYGYNAGSTYVSPPPPPPGSGGSYTYTYNQDQGTIGANGDYENYSYTTYQVDTVPIYGTSYPNPTPPYLYEVTTTTQTIEVHSKQVYSPEQSTNAAVVVSPYSPSAYFCDQHWGPQGRPPTVDLGWSAQTQMFDVRLAGWVLA